MRASLSLFTANIASFRWRSEIIPYITRSVRWNSFICFRLSKLDMNRSQSREVGSSERSILVWRSTQQRIITPIITSKFIVRTSLTVVIRTSTPPIPSLSNFLLLECSLEPLNSIRLLSHYLCSEYSWTNQNYQVCVLVFST